MVEVYPSRTNMRSCVLAFAPTIPLLANHFNFDDSLCCLFFCFNVADQQFCCRQCPNQRSTLSLDFFFTLNFIYIFPYALQVHDVLAGNRRKESPTDCEIPSNTQLILIEPYFGGSQPPRSIPALVAHWQCNISSDFSAGHLMKHISQYLECSINNVANRGATSGVFYLSHGFLRSVKLVRFPYL